MEQLLNEIRISYIDPGINQLLGEAPEKAGNSPYAMRFNQSEEYFIEFDTPLIIPHFPIHHDIRRPIPDADYAHTLKDVIKQLVAMLPDCFSGLTYFFDPAEILKPCFYRLYKVGEETYLYLLRIDLLAKPFEAEIIERGTNDTTQAYSTHRLYLESELIPLEAVMWEAGKVKAFRIKQLISQTWIGESGKGYLVRGIWMDTDLSKFFTRLFVPAGRKIYPYFPLFCKYKTICGFSPILSSEGRRTIFPLLHNAIKFLVPEIEGIQEALKNEDFSATMPNFTALREKVPESWMMPLKHFSVEAYLNEREHKEYALHHVDTKK
jgi:hypothetical protein